MPLYAYKGIGTDGRTVNGTHDAESPKSLRAALRRDGVVVTDVAESKKGNKGAAGGGGLNKEVSFGDLFGGVKKAEVASFTRQVATLLKAGIPLAETLAAVFEQLENLRNSKVLVYVTGDRRQLETKIGSDVIDYDVDRNPHKQGFFLPGTRLLIYSSDRLLEDRPDYVLLLTWNFSEEILQQQAAFRATGGKFILPVPKPKVV